MVIVILIEYNDGTYAIYVCFFICKLLVPHLMPLLVLADIVRSHSNQYISL